MYEYDAKRAERYIRELERAFRKKIDDPHCTCVVVDACNDKLSHFMEMVHYGCENGYDVLIGELPLAKPFELERRSSHKRLASDIADILRDWESAPKHVYRLDLTKIVADMPTWIVSRNWQVFPQAEVRDVISKKLNHTKSK